MPVTRTYTCDRCRAEAPVDGSWSGNPPEGWASVDYWEPHDKQAGEDDPSLDLVLCPTCGPVLRRAILKELRQ